ncbi:MAG TPA: FHA domain-containing protein [candidate division Zixibacteria bacterium]|nr:FHA domain-containing protein [candidate division Zixibacteria bacterium]
MEIAFEFISGENTGKRLKFNQSSVLVGRSEDADLSINSDIVSYEHCRFTVKAEGLYLSDLGSSNGTFVNGNHHNSGFVSSGDHVSFGQGGPEIEVTFSESGRSEKPRKRSSADRTQMVQAVSKKLLLKVDGGESYEFLPGRIEIGRDSACDLTLDMPMVSRIHAEINYIPPTISIKDLDSTNGTYVNGERITTAALKFGDSIMIGEKGPQIGIGEGAKFRRPLFTRLLKVLLPIIFVVLLAGAGYRYVYQPWEEKRSLARQTLQEYVSYRLIRLSKDLGDPQNEIPLIFVENTVKYVDKFTGNLRGWFERSLERSEMHMGMVRRMLRGAGLPEEFAYLAFVESGYDSTATSPAGARGLWQFMPATARDFGLTVNNDMDERVNAKKSTEAACKYIKQLYNLYNSYMLAMASYNTGLGRIRNALMRMDVIEQNRFWYLVKNDMLHNETVEYVPKIMAAMIIATDPVKFGFSEAPEKK